MKRIIWMAAIFIVAVLTLSACAAKGPATPISNPADSTLVSANPSGEYTASGLELRNVTATFSGQSLVIYSDYFDHVVTEKYTYSIENDGTTITMTNLATNNTATYSFKYVKETESVVIGSVTYWK
jgi:hypothetical protein